jgi:type I restriction enzyme S subunit
MLDEKQVTGDHLRQYLRNVDVQWGRINTDELPRMDFDEASRLKYSLRHGDILVCEGGEVGRAAVWEGMNEPQEVYFQKALHRLRPLDERDECPRYMYWCLHAAASGSAYADGGKSTIAHLPADAFRRVRFPKPTRAEQERVANFLDEKSARIEALIAEKERLVLLLTSASTDLLHDAVTKGMNAAPLRSSGREWIGDIPQHWSAPFIRKVARLESGHTPSRQHPEYWVDCTIPWFSLADVWQIRDGIAEVVTETAELVSELGVANSSARLLPAGTVMLSRTASVGFSAIMGLPMATTQDFVNWVCGPLVLPEYLLYVFRSMRTEFDRLKFGSTHSTIYMPDVAKLSMPLPPLAEQRAIVKAARERKAKIDELRALATAEVDRLREYRSSLISAAVTGQLDLDTVGNAQTLTAIADAKSGLTHRTNLKKL